MFETVRKRYNTYLLKFLTDQQRKELNLTQEEKEVDDFPVKVEETKFESRKSFSSKIHNSVSDVSDIQALT